MEMERSSFGSTTRSMGTQLWWTSISMMALRSVQPPSSPAEGGAIRSFWEIHRRP